MKTRLLLMGACVAGLYGCNAANQPAANSQNTVSAQSNPPAIDATADATDPVAGPAEALSAPAPEVEAKAARDAVAERARRYAAEMEKSVSALAADAPTPQPSQVDWAELLSAHNPPPADGQSPATPVAVVESKPERRDPADQRAATVQPPVDAQAPARHVPAPAEKMTADVTNANAGISLDGHTDGPMVIPEGQEIAVFAPVVPMETAPAVAVPPGKVASAAQAPAPPSPSTRAPVASTDSDALARRLTENPRDVAAHLDYQLQRFAAGKSVPELTALAPLPVEDREVIAAVMDGLSNFRASVQADGNQLLSRKVRPLVDMTERLKASADLSVPTIALCREVDGFGVYDPIEPATFPSGREAPVILYCEVANFSSQKADGKHWETALSHTATLYRDSGVPVWSDKTTNVVDHSRNRRSDFFVVKMLRLPATLTPGRYVLKASVVDRQSNRMAEGSTTLTIVSADGMAKTE